MRLLTLYNRFIMRLLCYNECMSSTILIAEDDDFQREALGMLLHKRLGLNTAEATHGREAIDILASPAGSTIGLVILDINMPVMGGMEALEIIAQRHPDVPVIMLTASTDIDVAVKALQNGAIDFVSKPWAADRIITTVRNALQLSQVTRELSRLKRKEKGEMGFDDLIGHNGGLAAIAHTGRKAAASNIPVLITGETGTGKEMVARAIHGDGLRAGKPFVAVNCGAIPANLIESTLFGHEKGAFTGAIAKTPGRFREADTGTIFLDEIGELTLDAQTKLLRVLQQKEVEPVGASQPIQVNVRIISATNKDLEREVRDGRFREDLFFRLNVLHMELPPLRTRSNDIPALVRYFLSRQMASGHPMHDISPPALDLLSAYNWPGNVRELENTLYRACVLADHIKLDISDFAFLRETNTTPQSISAGQPALSVSLLKNNDFKTLPALEEEIIDIVLRHYNGHVTKATKVLGIPKSTFYRRMKT